MRADEDGGGGDGVVRADEDDADAAALAMNSPTDPRSGDITTVRIEQR